MNDMNTLQHERQAWMRLLALAPAHLLERWAAAGLPEHAALRAPETGLVMVRARAGATGDRFNMGEMTLTRCAVRLASGESGVAYVQGRDKRHALLAAIADACLQGPRRAEVSEALLKPVQTHLEQRDQSERATAQRSRVEFFTVSRGDE